MIKLLIIFFKLTISADTLSYVYISLFKLRLVGIFDNCVVDDAY